MSTKMLQAASSRLKHSHALIASLILAVVGSTSIVSPASAQQDDRRGSGRRQDAGSGMSRMGNMGRPSAPSQAPAARPSSPPPAPRVSSPAPAPRMSAPSQAPRMSSPPPSISSPAPAPRVAPPSRSGSGGSPILRMGEPSRSIDAPAPRQAPSSIRQNMPPQRTVEAPRQPSSPPPAAAPRTRTQPQGGAPINRMRPRDAAPAAPRDVTSGAPTNRTPRVTEVPNTPDRSVEIPRSGPRQTNQQARDNRAGIRTTPTPGSPIHQLRANPDARPSNPPKHDDRGPRGGRDGHGNDGRDGRGDWNGRDRDGRDGRGDWNGRDRDGRDGRGDWNGRDRDGRNNWNGRDWNHRDRDWHGHKDWHDNSWKWRSNWRHNHWGHHHHKHSSFLVAPSLYYSTWPYYHSYGYGSGVNWGLGFSWGSSSLYYNSYRAPRYYTYSDPLCIYPSYYRSRYYYYPLSYSLYYPPSYIDSYTYYPTDYSTTTIYYDQPSYTDTYYYPSTSSGLIDYSAKAPAYTGSYSDVYVNNGFTPAPSSVGRSTPAEAEPITVYRASKDQGQLVWSDTATSIVNTLLNSTDDRAQVAQRFLGKTLAGGWEVTLDEIRTTADGTALTTRSSASSGTGTRPTIVVQIPRKVTGLEVGQRLSVTGRLTELTVNDPEHAGGLLVLEEGDASW